MPCNGVYAVFVYMKKQLIYLSFVFVSAISLADELNDNAAKKLIDAAKERTLHQVRYDGAYLAIAYPNGDVPANIGVCTDVVIRSFRQLGVDLQQRVHEDMVASFDAYPSKRLWGLSRTDKNIDHRRVPNLRTFFKRHGKSLTVTQASSDYLPGDIVTWVLPGNLPHIGIVIDELSDDGERPLVVHNIGEGPKKGDMLFDYKITGHYRYFGQ